MEPNTDQPADSRGARPNSIHSVVKALRVLEALRGSEPLGVTELARRVALPKASVQRILATLHTEGWIREAPHPPTRWIPAQKLLIFASRVYREDSLRQAARPVMEALRDATSESVTLSVPQGRNLVLVDRADSQLPIRVHSDIGSTIPIHATSIGKAILASMPRAEVVELLGNPLDRFTDRTLVDMTALGQDLDTIEVLGYSINWGEYADEIVGIGAAITDSSGRGTAGVALAIPTLRCTRERASELGPYMRNAAKQIEETLSLNNG
jgi:IclR family acetate operon transcriptional repressor